MHEATTTLARPRDEYGGTEDRPLRGYLALMSAYGATAATVGALVVRSKRRPSFADLALAAVATQKLSRVLTKDSITSPVRAPFVRYDEPAGAGEVNEQVRRDGPTHALGELLTCPLCMDVWVGTGFVGGMSVAPRFTRFVASVFAVTSVSNALHFAWDALKQTEA